MPEIVNPADLVAGDLRFVAQARRTPDACVARFEADSLTFREMDEQPIRLAALLVSRGVVPGDGVGIAGEGSSAPGNDPSPPVHE